MFYTKIESAISHIDISILQKSTFSPAYLRHVEVPQWLHSHRKSLGALPNELPLLGAAALLRARELRRSQLGGGLRCYGGSSDTADTGWDGYWLMNVDDLKVGYFTAKLGFHH